MGIFTANGQTHSRSDDGTDNQSSDTVGQHIIYKEDLLRLTGVRHRRHRARPFILRWSTIQRHIHRLEVTLCYHNAKAICFGIDIKREGPSPNALR